MMLEIFRDFWIFLYGNLKVSYGFPLKSIQKPMVSYAFPLKTIERTNGFLWISIEFHTKTNGYGSMSFTASAKKWRAMGESNGGKVVDNN